MRLTFGNISRQRTKRLLEALLAFGDDFSSHKLRSQLSRDTQVSLDRERLQVFAQGTLRSLAEIVNFYESLVQKDYPDVYLPQYVKLALEHFNQTLKIYADRRRCTQGAKLWHFRITLWHSLDELDRNLAEFESIWKQATQGDVAKTLTSEGSSLVGKPLAHPGSDDQAQSYSGYPHQEKTESKPIAVNPPLPRSSINFNVDDCKICAYRLVPFYLGSFGKSSVTKDGYHNHVVEDLEVVLFEDGFSVTVIKEESSYRNVVDFLLKRRSSHLSILEKESTLTQRLLCKQRKPPSNPLIFHNPSSLTYVMSLHHISYAHHQVSLENYKLMAEPSILGITDDPKDICEIKNCASNYLSSLGSMEALEKNIQTINTNNACIYISWANVIVGTQNNESSDMTFLIQLELVLQKLWYKLFLYAQNLGCLESYFNSLDSTKIREIKKEIIKTKIEYMNFVRPDAMGASHLNLLKEKLLLTSRIDEIYQSFINKANVFLELEGVL